MNAAIHAMYWDNIDARIPEYQKKVFDHFKLPIIQHKLNGVDHGTWMDWVLHNTKNGIALFMDIDCIPLDKQHTDEAIKHASDGILFGAAGCANHLDKTRAYAGAWYVSVNSEIWHAIGRPTCRAQANSDVAQNLTDAWRNNDIHVALVPPTEVEVPKWDLPNEPLAYGIGTTYADYCYHLFESRSQQNIERFVNKCEEILNGR